MKRRAYFFLFSAMVTTFISLTISLLFSNTDDKLSHIGSVGAVITLGIVSFSLINIAGKMFIETYRHENRVRGEEA